MFIVLPRVMDDAPMCIKVEEIKMVCANANEQGIIEGTAAVYMTDGLALAVNMEPYAVIKVLEAHGQDVFNYMPPESEEEVN